MVVIVAPMIGVLVFAMIIGIVCMVYRRNRLERRYELDAEEGEENSPNTAARA
jgi:hypothetical protein